MRLSDYLAIAVIIVLTYLFINSSLNPTIIESVDTVLVKGETIRDTTILNKYVYIDKWSTKTDTIYIDSSGYHAKADFLFNKDSVRVTGKVYYDTPMFSFSHLQVKYPYKTITINRTDTLKVTVYETKMFTHGVQAGFGYGVINKQLDVYIGYGFQITF